MLHKHLIAVTAPEANPDNIICYGNRRISVLTPCLFRVEEDEEANFLDEATQAVWFRNMPAVPYEFEKTEEEAIVRTEKATLVLCRDMDKSYVLLGGKKAMIDNAQNLLGTCRTLDCCDGDFFIPLFGERKDGHTIELEKGVVSRNGVAVYDDSATLILAKEGTLAPRKREKDLYVFACGREYREAVKTLYRICGGVPRIPRFALGNWWSRYHSYSDREYLGAMDSFAQRGIPFTVATIDMDWHWSENLAGGEDGWTGYSWNTELFPDYRGFLQKLHDRGLHVTMNLHPALGVRNFEDMYEEMAERMGIDPASGEAVPFNIGDADFVNAYFDILHRPYEREGVDFWWIDWQQGTSSDMAGLDPLWGLNHYHTLDISREKTSLILSRYSGVGAHRYPVGFSGDTHVTWDTLRYLPYFTSTAANIGYTWWSHDIGGHMGGEKDNELYVRFVQFGIFSPINRLHSTKNDIFTKDPAAYGNGAGLIAREYLRLRHAMIPFLYSASCETAEQGLALVEPTYYDYPEEESAYQCPGEYMFGRQLLAAPVTEKSSAGGMAETEVWLPPGTWTDFFTGDEYEGGKWQKMARGLDSFPLLAKEGGFFVLDGRREGNSVSLPRRLSVMVFSGEGNYSLYEDEGRRRAVTVFSSDRPEQNVQRLRFSVEDSGGILPERCLVIEFRNIMRGAVTIRKNGDVAEGEIQEGDFLTVTLKNIQPNSEYELVVVGEFDIREKYEDRLRRIITLLEWDNAEKEKIYAALRRADSEREYVQILQRSSLPEIYRLRLSELTGYFRRF